MRACAAAAVAVAQACVKFEDAFVLMNTGMVEHPKTRDCDLLMRTVSARETTARMPTGGW